MILYRIYPKVRVHLVTGKITQQASLQESAPKLHTSHTKQMSKLLAPFLSAFGIALHGLAECSACHVSLGLRKIYLTNFLQMRFNVADQSHCATPQPFS